MELDWFLYFFAIILEYGIMFNVYFNCIQVLYYFLFITSRVAVGWRISLLSQVEWMGAGNYLPTNCQQQLPTELLQLIFYGQGLQYSPEAEVFIYVPSKGWVVHLNRSVQKMSGTFESSRTTSRSHRSDNTHVWLPHRYL